MKKCFILIGILLLLLVNSASAATLNVGSTAKYHTIQSAVNAAHNGDTVNVASGTYKEDVDLSNQITLIGTNFPTVNGFGTGESGSVIIRNFKLTKGIGIGSHASAYIRNCKFDNCVINGGTVIHWNSCVF
jgi:nitrous oxidase accessory protein NosD